jgi:hypothetical protein
LQPVSVTAFSGTVTAFGGAIHSLAESYDSRDLADGIGSFEFGLGVEPARATAPQPVGLFAFEPREKPARWSFFEGSGDDQEDESSSRLLTLSAL